MLEPLALRQPPTSELRFLTHFSNFLSIQDGTVLRKRLRGFLAIWFTRITVRPPFTTRNNDEICGPLGVFTRDITTVSRRSARTDSPKQNHAYLQHRPPEWYFQFTVAVNDASLRLPVDLIGYLFGLKMAIPLGRIGVIVPRYAKQRIVPIRSDTPSCCILTLLVRQLPRIPELFPICIITLQITVHTGNKTLLPLPCVERASADDVFRHTRDASMSGRGVDAARLVNLAMHVVTTILGPRKMKRPLTSHANTCHTR